MTMSAARRRRERAAAEAADWAARFDAKPVSHAEHEEFVEWLRESHLHVSEMLRMFVLRDGLSNFSHWDQVAPLLDKTPDNLIYLDGLRAPRVGRRGMAKSPWVRFGGIAAMLLVGFLVVMLQRPAVTVIHTQAGDRRELTLADGSIVKILPNSDLRIRLGEHLRSVTLERGGASFHVAKDARRPFVVDASVARVQAVGTVFSVARTAEDVVVTVSEGRVNVIPESRGVAGATSAANPRVISLTIHQGVAVSPAGITSSVRQLEKLPDSGWGDERLVFEQMAVADVVKQFNQRNPIQIRLADPTLAARTVSGTFDPGDPKSFVEFLHAVAGTTSMSNADEIIVMTRGAGAAPSVPR